LRRAAPGRLLKLFRVNKEDGGGRWLINVVELFRSAKVKVERYRGARILFPWMESLELGMVGRFARNDYDDASIVGALDEMLAV
jgi:hypothetical protein